MRSERLHWRFLLICLIAAAFTAGGEENMAQNNSPSPKRDINVVLAAHDKKLLAIPDVVGVYVGTLEDRRTLCLRVMLARKNLQTERKIPRSIDGYPVRVEVSGEIRPLSQ